ncbi:nitroreductase family protein [Aquibium sp. A9E412]|uniref:nitroreductase family protein n=1 Tax=Aquibium sp. A9E412 TaxID=2976767 RepID=UPI0025B013B8|nr:nitroreductase family protein [Aquibium sp. A9E412]MDN2568564.1 nitroreductase family protein [Aquibium sp. A9E412]
MFSRQGLAYRAVPLPDRQAWDDAAMAQAARAFLARMRTRHTVRDFCDRPVPRGVIEDCVAAAGTAPSGANHQPWHFVAVGDAATKHAIRRAAEEEEARFYAGGAGDEWLKALEPIGTGADKPHLEVAPWLIVVFAQRYGFFDDGTRYKNYYVPESVGIATGFLIAALHHAGLAALTHTPNPMRFLNGLLGRPESEKPVMILAVGHPAADATVPAAAKIKKPLEAILTVRPPDAPE